MHTKTPPRIAFYARVSGDEQREKQTIQTQLEFGERFAELQGVKLVDTFPDDGFKGVIPFADRPEGARLLREARAGRITQVWVYKLDRLGRAIRVILNAVDQLEQAGCSVRSLTEPFDTATPAGRFMLSLLAAAAELERDNIVERTRGGIERAARNGVWLGNERPYGYQIEGKGRTARLVIDETEAEVVRLMYQLYIEQDLSCDRVADYFNAEGVPTMHPRGTLLTRNGNRPSAGKWTEGRIHDMLTSRTYCGIHEWGKQSKNGRELIRREVPAIVSVETWERAQQVLDQRRTYSKRNGRHPYLLRGLIFCGVCGRPYYGATMTGYRYYRCKAKQPARTVDLDTDEICTSKSLPGSVEDEVWADLEQFLRNPEPVVNELRHLIQAQAGDEHAQAEELRRLDALHGEKDGERQRVLGIFRKGWITEAEVEVQLAEIEREQTALAVQRAHVSSRAATLNEHRESYLQAGVMLRTLGERLDQGLPLAEKRRLIELLVERIDVETIGAGRSAQARIHAVYCFNVGSATTESGGL